MRSVVDVLILDGPRDPSATGHGALQHMPEFHMIGEADLGQTGTDNAVALVFLDEIQLADGIARIVGLKARQPNLRTLVAFGALKADDLCALLTAGADAFLGRSKSSRDLGAALLALAEGSNCLVPPEQPRAIPSQPGDGLGLTQREAEVLRFLSSGFSNKEVARRLALSVRTVETHRLNLRRKTQTGRLKDLVSLALQLGLAPVSDNKVQRADNLYRH